MTLAFCTPFDTIVPLILLTTHTGTITSGIRVTARDLFTPQAPRAPVHLSHPLNLARHDRTHLVAIRFKGAYCLPPCLKEAILLLAPGHKTLPQLTPIVPHFPNLCVLVNYFIYFILYLF